MTDKPMQGVKILDFSRVVAGPYATRLLSDLGADVLKVEPPDGDITRLLGPKTEGARGYFLQQNIGKRNICIDLNASGARDLVLKLAAKADIVVENFRPGVMDRFGIGWSDLKEVNPKLVMLSISGFGQTGPERARAAYAPIVHAEAGLIARQASAAGGAVVDLQMSAADTYSSLHGVIGLLAALRVAEQSGVGQHVDISMIASLHSSDDYAPWALEKGWPKPEENLVWDAPEGQKVLVSGDLRWLWHVLSTQAGVADPTPEGAGLETKIRCRRDAIAEWIRSWSEFDELAAQLDSLNLAWGRVRQFGDDAYGQTSVEALNIVIDVKDEHGNPRKTIQSPYRFSHSQSGIESSARVPMRGEHNLDALRDWLKLDPAQIDNLTEAGVLVQATD